MLEQSFLTVFFCCHNILKQHFKISVNLKNFFFSESQIRSTYNDSLAAKYEKSLKGKCLVIPNKMKKWHFFTAVDIVNRTSCNRLAMWLSTLGSKTQLPVHSEFFTF